MVLKKCITCQRKYEAYDKTHKGRRAGNKRRSNSINCSPKCSKTYERIVRYIKSPDYRKKSRKNNK